MLTTAASQTDICNFALGRCGIKQFITSLDPTVDTSQEAACCALFWDVVRQKLLAGFPWKFATRIAGLQEFVPQASSIEHLGTGVAAPFTIVYPDTAIEGTYNVLVQVVSATSIRASADGGVTWGASRLVTGIGATGDKYLNSSNILSGLPIGSGLEMTGTVQLAQTAYWGGLVAGDIYRFTLTDGISPEYTYAYALPSDILIGRYLWPGSRSVRQDQRTPWKRGSFGGLDVLWTDNAPDQTPTVIYVEDVTSAERFTPGFADALAWRLAYEISGPLKAQVAPEDLNRAYLMALNEVRSTDFIEAGEDAPPDSPTIAARGYQWTPYGVGTWPPGGWFPF